MFNSIGDEIDTHDDAEGGAHLGVSVIQTALTSSGNSSTTNLTAGDTFTGTSEEMYGANGIQFVFNASEDCTVYVDQSIDNSNWDVIDSFACLANRACSRTIVSVAPFFKVRATNNGSSTTTFLRLATGMTPVISPLPRALNNDDRLNVETTMIGSQNTDRHVWVTPTNSISVESPTRLVGTTFDGTTKDTNFWTETVTGSGVVAQDGEIQLSTGATGNSTVKYVTVRKARFVVGAALKFQSITKFVTAGTTNNVRRIGAYTTADGFFFQLDGATFSVGWRKSSSDTLVSSGSFNGNIGPNYIMDANYHKLEIEWTPRAVFFYVDGLLLHKNTTGHLTGFLTLPITIENINDNALATDIVFDVIACAISRLGELITNPTFKFLGANATTVLKYGAGTLQRIVNLDNAGTVTIYDNTAASGMQIAVIDAVKALGTLTFNAPFSNGLTVVVASGAKITVIYE